VDLRPARLKRSTVPSAHHCGGERSFGSYSDSKRCAARLPCAMLMAASLRSTHRPSTLTTATAINPAGKRSTGAYKRTRGRGVTHGLQCEPQGGPSTSFRRGRSGVILTSIYLFDGPSAKHQTHLGPIAGTYVRFLVPSFTEPRLPAPRGTATLTTIDVPRLDIHRSPSDQPGGDPYRRFR